MSVAGVRLEDTRPVGRSASRTSLRCVRRIARGVVTGSPHEACDDRDDLVVLDRYIEHLRERLSRPATVKNAERVLRMIDREVGLEGLSPIRLREFFDDRDYAVSTRYVNWTIVRQWSAWYHEDEPDPFRMAKRPPKPDCRPRPVTREQLALLLDRVPPRTRDIVILAAFAGLRCGEISRVTREDLQEGLLGPVLVIPTGKGGIPGEVPAHPLVAETIRRYPPGRLFPIVAASISKIASRHFNEAGVDVSMHQLRHYYATDLYRSTRDVQVVQHAMRHRRLDTTSLYIRQDPETLFDAVTQMSVPTCRPEACDEPEQLPD